MDVELKTGLFIFSILYMSIKANRVAKFIEQRKQLEAFDVLSFFVIGVAIWTVLEKY